MTRIIDSLADIAADYDALFCDLWGCVHNGIAAFPEAVAALKGFRAGGGRVVLLTNAPRPWREVADQIERLGVPREGLGCHRHLGRQRAARHVRRRGRDKGLLHWGRARPRLLRADAPRRRRANDRARATDGGRGDRLYRPLRPARRPRGQPLRLPLRQDQGPEAPLRQPRHRGGSWRQPRMVRGRARRALHRDGGREPLLRQAPPAGLRPRPTPSGRARRARARCRILAVGDGIRTDIQGAQGEDIDSLFVTGGLAAQETGTTAQPDPDALEAFLAAEMVTPTYAIGFLR
jgi:hypothetical protein